MSGVPCPQCGFLVPQDFGVATCPNCQNVFMIQMDSQVDVGGVAQGSALNSMTSPASDPLPAASLENTPTPVPALEASDMIAEIQTFGNTEIAPNPITYTLKISGLERQELRKRLFEIFSEARLNFRSETLIKSIKDGHLEIKNLNPVKVSVLISRLRELPVQLSWKQAIYEVPEDTDLTRVPIRGSREV